MSDEWTTTQSEMSLAFQNGTIESASDADLMRFLINTCTGNIPNETVRHRELARAITINHIQAARLLRKLDSEYRQMSQEGAKIQIEMQKISEKVLFLTYAMILVGIAQIVTAVLVSGK